jgi:hypothetical protein
MRPRTVFLRADPPADLRESRSQPVDLSSLRICPVRYTAEAGNIIARRTGLAGRQAGYNNGCSVKPRIAPIFHPQLTVSPKSALVQPQDAQANPVISNAYALYGQSVKNRQSAPIRISSVNLKTGLKWYGRAIAGPPIFVNSREAAKTARIIDLFFASNTH